MALWGTLHGLGPFARRTRTNPSSCCRPSWALSAVLALAFAAVVAEKKRVDEERLALVSRGGSSPPAR